MVEITIVKVYYTEKLSNTKLPVHSLFRPMEFKIFKHLFVSFSWYIMQLCATSGSSLGYGFSRIMSKSPKIPAPDSEENGTVDGTLAAI